MKNSFKKILSSVLVAVMVMTAAPLSGFVGLELNFDWMDFSTKSSALSSSGKCGDNAFYEFDEEKKFLSISGSGEIYSNAFQGCDCFRVVEIGEGITEIGDKAFSYCSLMNSICLPDGLIDIGENAFLNCNMLMSIDIPESIIHIGTDAFKGCFVVCANIRNISKWCQILFDSAFSNPLIYSILMIDDARVTELTIPKGVTLISDYSFYGCSSIKNVIVSESVKKIGKYAFSGCEYLEGVSISDGVTGIDENAFSDCKKLERIDLPNSIHSIGTAAFKNCEKLQGISIPEGVDKIGKGVFEGCESLGSVVFGDNVTDIGEYAFNRCYLSEIVVSDRLKSIGKGAFQDCYISDVYYFGTEAEWKAIQIGDCNQCLLVASIHCCSKPGHSHTYSSVVTAPTCTKQGYTTYACTCGDSYVADYVNAKGHTEGEWKITKFATFTEEGIRSLYCSVCGEVVKTETIPRLTHGQVYGVEINDIAINCKQITTIKPTIDVDDGVKYAVEFSTSNPDVATVDKDGNITTLHKGSTIITCTVTDEYGNVVKDTCNVNVSLSFGQWLIWILLLGFLWY